MTELSLLDYVGLGLLTVLWLYLARVTRDHLIRKDTQQNRDNLCPPHDWVETFMDGTGGVTGGSAPAGVRCTRCKRRPNNLPNGESWYGGF